MVFHFDPTFALLPKFGIGLRPMPTSEEDVKRVSKYLGVDLPDADLEENTKSLTRELEDQNSFLAKHLESDSIVDSGAYRKSMFIRDIVANNRDSRARRLARERLPSG